MAKVFLDANYLIHFNKFSKVPLIDLLDKHNLYISTLTCDIYCYINKVKIPNAHVAELFNLFSLIDVIRQITYKALDGPTNDFEDNIQLHCAAVAECNYFLTNDKKLLKMKFFGKTKIINKLSK